MRQIEPLSPHCCNTFVFDCFKTVLPFVAAEIHKSGDKLKIKSDYDKIKSTLWFTV